jgi:hypothetical protein
LVAEGHELIDFLDDAVLFRKGWQGNSAASKLGFIYGREVGGLFA